MNRRAFLRQSLLTGTGLGLAGLGALEAVASPTTRALGLHLLHTNDMHSRIDPFPMDGGRNAGKGGMTRLAALVESYRDENEALLLLDAGDFFQGTPYFNVYKGELELKLMSRMGYDASTLGNHEFDNGLEGLYEQLEHANFDILCANYDFSRTLLKDAFKPYKIVKRGGLKVGIFGVGIELAGLVGEKNYGQTRYLDPVAVAREIVSELRRQSCDLIICLSHLGHRYNGEKIDDLKLAARVPGIDLIIGGHTHTFLERPVPVIRPDGGNCLVTQAGTAALRAGHLYYSKNTAGKVLAKDFGYVDINEKVKTV